MFFANKNSWICEIIRTFALAIVPPLTERWNVFLCIIGEAEGYNYNNVWV